LPTRNVDLTDHLDHFVESGVASGRFSDASDVVREALRLLEQRELADKAKLDWLRASANEGFVAADRGDYTVLGDDQEITDFVREVHEEASNEIAVERKRD
jgi:antitoxin ParD1/3/4